MSTPSSSSAIDATTIRVVAIRLVRCTFQLKQQSRIQALEANFTFQLARNFASSRDVAVALGVSVFEETEQAPFSVNVVYEGYFAVEDDRFTEGLRQFAQVNAVALLIPYLRETISALTTRAGYQPLVLPLIDAQDLVSNLERAELATETPKTPERRPD